MPELSQNIRNEVLSNLARIEKENLVTVLYACESGSRAWGFESKDSDYDVRFIYLHKTDWYLKALKEPGDRDVIEEPISNELDICGWDLIKTLGLFRKSNTPLFEWLKSPHIYYTNCYFVESLCEALPKYYSPYSCLRHYLHMAEGNMRKYLSHETVWTKKYFYVLRPVLACIWIEKGYGLVPTEFSKLLDALVPSGDLRVAIDSLLKKKISGEELDTGPRIKIISEFLEFELSRLNEVKVDSQEDNDPEVLNRIFINTLIHINGGLI